MQGHGWRSLKRRFGERKSKSRLQTRKKPEFTDRRAGACLQDGPE
jgi:hypothetical protein